MSLGKISIVFTLFLIERWEISLHLNIRDSVSARKGERCCPPSQKTIILRYDEFITCCTVSFRNFTKPVCLQINNCTCLWRPLVVAYSGYGLVKYLASTVRALWNCLLSLNFLDIERNLSDFLHPFVREIRSCICFSKLFKMSFPLEHKD